MHNIGVILTAAIGLMAVKEMIADTANGSNISNAGIPTIVATIILTCTSENTHIYTMHWILNMRYA